METSEILMVLLKKKKTENVKIICEIKLLISLIVGPHEFLPCENETI